MIKLNEEDGGPVPHVHMKKGESATNARIGAKPEHANLGPCPLPRPKPAFEWFFVSEVIESGTTSDQLLRLWEQGRISMWVTLPSGAYFLPDNARYYHLETFGPVQISSEALPDMANHGEARIRNVATPPKYDDKWRIIYAGQFFELPDPPLIKFGRLRITHEDFADIIALEEYAKVAAGCEEATLEAQEGVVEGKHVVGRKRQVPQYAQTEADRVACELYDRTGEGRPSKGKLCTEGHLDQPLKIGSTSTKKPSSAKK